MSREKESTLVIILVCNMCACLCEYTSTTIRFSASLSLLLIPVVSHWTTTCLCIHLSLITACNFLKVDYYIGGHLIFRKSAKLVFTWEVDKRDWCLGSNCAAKNFSAAFCQHVTKQSLLWSHKSPGIRTLSPQFGNVTNVQKLKVTHFGHSGSDEESNQN